MPLSSAACDGDGGPLYHEAPPVSTPTESDVDTSDDMLFAVGTAGYEWSDATRLEPSTPEPDDVRRLVVRAWYPAAASGAEHSPYFLDPRSAELNAMLAGWPGDALAQIAVTAALDAPLARSARPFPVLIFSPGMSTPIELYGRQLAALASHGFVIFALTHPYATGMVVFSDGQLAPELPETGADGERDRSVATWSRDQRFALSQLERLAAPGSSDRMAGRIALDHVGVFGHSRGGAAAALSCLDDARFRACANLDGSISAPLETRAPQQPFLLMRTEIPESTLTGFFAQLPGVAHWVDVAGSNHNDFSDLPLLAAELAPSGIIIDPQSTLLGTLAPERSLEINTAVLDAFFGEWLQGRSTELFAAPPFGEVTVRSRR